MNAIETIKQGWKERLEDHPAINLAVGGTKMAAAFAMTIFAGIRFGNPALAAMSALSLAELPDLKWGAKDNATVYHRMGTSVAGRNGLRSVHKGVQYGTIGFCLAKLAQVVIRRDFSETGLFKMTAYLGGINAAMLPAVVTTWVARQEFLPCRNQETFRQENLLVFGLTYHPIGFRS